MSQRSASRVADATRLLAGVPLFEGLPPEDVRVVASQARVTAVSRREAFYRQGQPAQVFFVLRRGRVKLAQVSPEGDEVILRIIGAGEPLGTIAAVEPASTYPVSAVAIEPSEAFGWDGAAITTLMRRFPALAINAMKVTTRRLHDLQRQHREWMTERAENRIALALLRLLEHSGGEEGRGREVTFALSQQDLAQMAGTTTFTVSRTLGSWQAAGVIETGRRRLLIRQPQALVRIAASR
jgi:CRP-like cAMP-binding protein